MNLFLIFIISLVILNTAIIALFASINRFNNNTPQLNFIISAISVVFILIAFELRYFEILPDVDSGGLFILVYLLNIFILFQGVNLLTTSIRLKILAIIADSDNFTEKDVIDLYGGSGFIENRFKRLKSLSQIKQEDNNIVLISDLFYILSTPVYMARRVLKLNGEETLK